MNIGSTEIPERWINEFYSCFPDGAVWNIHNNRILIQYFKRGLSPKDTAKMFYTAG